MECSEPGAIRDEELVAFIEGESVRPAVIRHLAHCQRCSSQVALYRRLELELTSKLYRWDCPSNQVLGEYQLGLLDQEQAAVVQTHLRICVLCTKELATLIEFLDEDARPLSVERPAWVPRPLEQPARIPDVVPPIAAAAAVRLMDGVRQGAGRVRETFEGLQRVAAVFMPLDTVLQRGGPSLPTRATTWPRNYRADGVTISLQLESDPRQRDTLQLLGLVVGQGAEIDALNGTPVQVLLNGEVVQVQRIDELGNIIFSALSPATYTLELLFPQRTIVVEQLELTARD